MMMRTRASEREREREGETISAVARRLFPTKPGVLMNNALISRHGPIRNTIPVIPRGSHQAVKQSQVDALERPVFRPSS